MSLDYNKDRLVRRDTGLVAFDDNIYAFRSTYQFTRFIFLRARVDYDTLSSGAKAQFLLGWTPNSGTEFYVGYNDALVRNGFSPLGSPIVREGNLHVRQPSLTVGLLTPEFAPVITIRPGDQHGKTCRNPISN